jgi:hypothetical protein
MPLPPRPLLSCSNAYRVRSYHCSRRSVAHLKDTRDNAGEGDGLDDHRRSVGGRSDLSTS